MLTAPNVLRPRPTIGFRTAILQLILGALLFSVGTIGIVGYINSERTLEEIRQKHFSLVSLTLSREVSRILDPAERILPELKNFTDRGLINPSDSDRLGIFLAERLRQEENVAWLSFTNSTSGAFTGAWRDSEGAIGVKHSDPNIDNGRPKEFLLNLDGSRSPLPSRIKRLLQPAAGLYGPRLTALTKELPVSAPAWRSTNKVDRWACSGLTLQPVISMNF
jgi:hypothetical protein